MRGLAASARLQGQYRSAIKHLERVLEISREMQEFTGEMGWGCAACGRCGLLGPRRGGPRQLAGTVKGGEGVPVGGSELADVRHTGWEG
jgi:hypothetical protein